jgi:hypothetical protein
MGSRGALRRQGAGDVASLSCPRETAVENGVSELRPNGNRRDARPEVEKAARWFQRQAWKERMCKWRAGEGEPVAIAARKSRLCPRCVQLLPAQGRSSGR